jgi:hypothetical protein
LVDTYLVFYTNIRWVSSLLIHVLFSILISDVLRASDIRILVSILI